VAVRIATLAGVSELRSVFRVPCLACVAVLACIAVVTGCGSDGPDPAPTAADSDVPRSPAEMLLPDRDFPPGYQPSELGIIDLRDQNAAALAAAQTAQFDPPQCRPTADADLNGHLDPGNAAVSARQSPVGNTITELVTTAVRDIDADVRTTTGECSRVTVTITQGSTAGTTVVTDNQRLNPPALPTSLSLLVKSVATTNYPGGRTDVQQTLAGYAVVDGVTVQLVAISTEEGMSDLEFADLFRRAVARAAA
jgi:hypothetical protein